MGASATARNAERCVAVAYSGGRDSTALLHATIAAARPAGVRVLALHVHHGLMPSADAWQAHCESQCAAWAGQGADLRLLTTRLAGRPARGDSVEAWARVARYAALATMARAEGCTLVLLAHHRRDQAETWLLQALRGAGPAGLAAMPASIERDGIVWSRPWLDRSRADIDAYISRHDLGFVEDDSNADARFARNRLRLQVWPALEAAFPGAEAALADAARRAARADAALEELAVIDLQAANVAVSLDIDAVLALSSARRENLLRHWLTTESSDGVSASLLLRLEKELRVSGLRRWPLSAGRRLVAHRGRLQVIADRPVTSSVQREAELSLRRAGRHRLPGWGGTLVVTRVRSGGVPFAWLAALDLRARAGAEQFQSGFARPPRSLKKQYQQAGVPAWERDGPLVYSGGQLVFVPGLGIDARVIAMPGQPQASLAWEGSGPRVHRD